MIVNRHTTGHDKNEENFDHDEPGNPARSNSVTRAC
jgi:hypothetical protein